MIFSEEFDVFSEDEASEGCSRGRGEFLSEELEFVFSEDEASSGDAEEFSEECEELLSEDSGLEFEALFG